MLKLIRRYKNQQYFFCKIQIDNNHQKYINLVQSQIQDVINGKQISSDIIMQDLVQCNFEIIDKQDFQSIIKIMRNSNNQINIIELNQIMTKLILVKDQKQFIDLLFSFQLVFRFYTIKEKKQIECYLNQNKQFIQKIHQIIDKCDNLKSLMNITYVIIQLGLVWINKIYYQIFNKVFDLKQITNKNEQFEYSRFFRILQMIIETQKLKKSHMEFIVQTFEQSIKDNQIDAKIFSLIVRAFITAQKSKYRKYDQKYDYKLYQEFTQQNIENFESDDIIRIITFFSIFGLKNQLNIQLFKQLTNQNVDYRILSQFGWNLAVQDIQDEQLFKYYTDNIILCDRDLLSKKNSICQSNLITLEYIRIFKPFFYNEQIKTLKEFLFQNYKKFIPQNIKEDNDINFSKILYAIGYNIEVEKFINPYYVDIAYQKNKINLDKIDIQQVIQKYNQTEQIPQSQLNEEEINILEIDGFVHNVSPIVFELKGNTQLKKKILKHRYNCIFLSTQNIQNIKLQKSLKQKIQFLIMLIKEQEKTFSQK